VNNAESKHRQATATLWELFSSFFRIGLFTFGGGYAMLPLVEKEVIDNKGWTTNDEILDIYALAQSVPGVIAVNTSIFLGNRLRGLAGAIAACVGIIAPSIIIIVLIAMFFTQLQSNMYVLRAFSGVRAAVVGLVAAAGVRIALGACKDNASRIIGIAAFCLSLFTDLHAVWLIIGGGVAGYVVYLRTKRGKQHDPA
jgi:chromate transporter